MEKTYRVSFTKAEANFVYSALVEYISKYGIEDFDCDSYGQEAVDARNKLNEKFNFE